MIGGIFEEFPFMGRPVRDTNGHELRLVRVTRTEMTCLVCGETTAQDYCLRCSDIHQGVIIRRLIPTTSYLKANEYVVLT
jgi:hypothetical protein